jgi:hypothetical protein
VLFNRRKFGFVFHHAKVVALKIVVADALHANLVVGVAKESHKLWMADPPGLPLELAGQTLRQKPSRNPRARPNYFRAQKLLSSGVVEGLNNKAKVTMRKSYGFRTYRVLELALYHSLGSVAINVAPQPL